MKVTTFKSGEDLVHYIDDLRKRADSAAESWQKDIKTGDFFLRLLDGLVIYGKVIEPDLSDFEGIPEEEMSDEMRSEYEWEKNAYKAPHMANMRFSNCFSQLCPEGELGDTHVCNMNMKITEEQFEQAKAAGWPCDPPEVLGILGLDIPHLKE